VALLEAHDARRDDSGAVAAARGRTFGAAPAVLTGGKSALLAWEVLQLSCLPLHLKHAGRWAGVVRSV
jgi:hypothetical protein